MSPIHRPDHPDFWLLSETVIDNDTAMDNQTITFEDKIAQVIDLDSLTYMATQRALRALGPAATNAQRARLASMFMDGFMVGVGYQAKKSNPPSEEDDRL